MYLFFYTSTKQKRNNNETRTRENQYIPNRKKASEVNTEMGNPINIISKNEPETAQK